MKKKTILLASSALAVIALGSCIYGKHLQNAELANMQTINEWTVEDLYEVKVLSMDMEQDSMFNDAFEAMVISKMGYADVPVEAKVKLKCTMNRDTVGNLSLTLSSDSVTVVGDVEVEKKEGLQATGTFNFNAKDLTENASKDAIVRLLKNMRKADKVKRVVKETAKATAEKSEE